MATELQRLKAHFCKDPIIEFRVCRFGIGTNGQKAMQAVADAVGIPVTAPMGEISSLAAIGGVATARGQAAGASSLPLSGRTTLPVAPGRP